jgi:hypothetical protein
MERPAAELSHIFRSMEVPLQVCESELHGKHVLAAAPIRAGDVLFEEVPLVSWPLTPLILHNVPFCWHCIRILREDIASIAKNTDAARAAKTTISSLPSTSSSTELASTGDDDGTLFCCEDCRAAAAVARRILSASVEAALRGFHDSESKRMSGLAPDDDFIPISVESVARCVVMVASRFIKTVVKQQLQGSLSTDTSNKACGMLHRIIFDAAVKPLNRLVEPPLGTKFAGFDVAEWCVVVKQALEPRLTAELWASCCTGTEVMPSWIAEVVEGLTSFSTLNTILGQLSINSQAINVVILLPSEKDKEEMGTASASSTTANSNLQGDSDGLSRPNEAAAMVGAGLYSLQSSFNHSCRPSAAVVHLNQTHEIAVRALRDIAEGEEVTISYLPSNLPLAERRQKLASYFFQCECERCREEEKLAQHCDPTSN